MANKKGKILTLEHLEILNAGSEGKAVARHEDRVIFVKGGVPGDIVNVRITKRKKSFWEADITQIITSSPLRIEPFCEHFGVCGGCKWQNLAYEDQLKFKAQQVKDNLTRLAKVELPEINPIMGSENHQYYRNKMEYSFSNARWLTKEEIESGADFNRNALGFHVPGRFDKIVDVERCFLQEDFSNQVRNFVRAKALEMNLPFYDLIQHEGLLRNMIVRTASTGEKMVIMSFGAEMQEQYPLLEALKNEFPQIDSLFYVNNTKKNDTISDLNLTLYHGKDHIMEAMEGLHFKIGPHSFYQTNSAQAYELYKETRRMAQLTGNELVYDLYTGTGTIAQFVAKEAQNVIGIEYVEPAIVDAKFNAQANNLSHLKFFAGDMKDVLDESFIATHGQPDVIITDPPRAGMHPDVIQTIINAAPKRIVYVSCNPATQARDLQLLDEHYKVVEVQPVDMFPHTHHVENIVALEIK